MEDFYPGKGTAMQVLNQPSCIGGNNPKPQPVCFSTQIAQILRIMKLTAILILACCLHVSAGVFSQNITFSGTNVPLDKVFASIEKQTGYVFFYKDEIIKDAQPVTIHVKNAPIREVLEQCLKGQSLEFSIEDKTVFITRKTASTAAVIEKVRLPQDPITVTGKVTDDQGNPLVGANVKIKGSGIGTTTDNQGRFTLPNVDENAVLEISYVGRETQLVPVRGKTPLVINLMQKNSLLDETVVVAYGKEKKIHLTGSVATISGQEIQKTPLSNIGNALVGRMPGLISFNTTGQPGNDNPTLLIRGLSTLGDNSPLIVIDGIPRNSFAYIDPNDIESISMLKDASTIALFGARAANGVILITTKRGVSGKSSISYTANLAVQHPTRLIKSLDSYSTSILWNEAHKNEGTFNPSPGGVFGYNDATLEIIKNGTDPDRYANVDWYRTIFNRHTIQTQHNLSVTGGGDNMRYFVSAGYLNQEGLYPAANFKRYNLRANLDGTIANNLQFGLNLSGRTETNDAFYTYAFTGFGEFASGNGIVTAALYTPNIEPIQYTNGLYHFSFPSGGNMYLNSKGEGGYNKTNNNLFESSLFLTYQFPFIKGLSAKALLAIDKSFIFKKSLNKPYTSYILNNDGTFAPRVNTTTTSLSEAFLQSQSITAEASLQYDRKFGNHTMKILLLGTQTQNKGDNFTAARSNLPTPGLDQLDLGSSNTATNSGSAFENARKSLVGRVSYNYNSRYLLDYSFRYDGSDVFPPGHRYGFFPAVAIGWVVSQEPFFKNISFIDYFKLRASYGQVGNDRVGQFQYLQTYQATGVYAFGGSAATSVPALVPGVIPNPDFTWERATISNIGIEAVFIKNMLSIEADYFYKRTKNILVPPTSSVPAVLGGMAPLQNAGIVDSRGVEFTLKFHEQFNDFILDVRPNFTINRSKVIFFPDPLGTPDHLKITGKPVSIDALKGYQAIGLYQSDDQIKSGAIPLYSNVKPGDIQYQDIDENGKINADDQIIITRGSTPRMIYGFNTAVGYKNLELNIFLQGAGDVETYLANEINNSFYAGIIQKAYDFQNDRWTLQNTNATYPRVTITSQNNRVRSSYWVRNSAYLRLKNAELAYTLSKQVFPKTGIQSIRLYINGSNLLTFSKLKIVDPESGASAISYPILKLYNFGIQIAF